MWRAVRHHPREPRPT